MSCIMDINGFYFDGDKRSVIEEKDRFLVVNVLGHSTRWFPNYPDCEHSIEDYVRYIRSNNIKAVVALMDDFSFLQQCPSIERLDLYPSFQAPNRISFDPVYQMPNLIMLQVCNVYGEGEKYWSEFDCAKLRSEENLVWFGTDCKRGILNLNALTHLKSLHLSSYRQPDLCHAIGSSRLDTLSLLRCGIRSLDGVQNSKSLTVVSLVDCFKLEDISALIHSRDTLHGLVIESCRNIRDHSVLGSLTNLTRLSLIGTGSIQSISFLDQLPNLKTLILEWNVLDGDLSYCDRLEDVTIWNKRHYNRKNNQFPKRSRDDAVLGDEGIEPWRQTVLR